MGIRLSLLGNVTSGLSALARQFAQVHGGAVALQAQLNRIRLTLLAGGALAGTGIFGLAMVGKTVNAAKEYVHQLAQMNTAGMTHLEIVRATQAAWRASYQVPTSDAAQNLAAIRELRMVFGNSQHAIENMPVVQQLQAILSVTRGAQGGHEEAYTVAKALEMRGAVRTPSEFTSQADMMAKAMVASGGKVNAIDFLQAFKYGKMATLGWSDAFTYTILPTLIQEMKGGGGGGGTGGPGSALMSAYAAVVGGTIPQKALKVWSKLGLLDPSKVEWTHAGEAKGLRPGGIRGWETFQQNPFAFAQNVLVPAMAKAGITSEAQMRQTMQYLFPNRTAGFLMGQMVLQAWKFQRDQKLIQGASGLSAYNQLLQSDPQMAELALQKQWHNMMIIFGYQIMPYVIRGTLVLVNSLRALGQWFKDHPTLTKALVIGFTALSAALTFSGTVLLLKGAIMAMRLAIVPLVSLAIAGGPITLLVIAAAALGVGLVELYNNWARIQPKLLNLWEGFAGWVGHNVDNALGLNSQQGSRYVPAPSSQRSGGGGSVYMDGRKVGSIVGKNMAGATRQQQGVSVFDSSMAPILPGNGVF